MGGGMPNPVLPPPSVSQSRQTLIFRTAYIAVWFIRVLFLMFLVVRVSIGAPTMSTGVVVRVWQSQDGLPSNVVRSVVQASDGYLWVATAEGVARFDGFEFEVIEPKGNLRNVQFAFSRLFASSGGDVWAATYQGGLFRVRKGQIELVLENLRSPSPPLVTQLLEDASGTVFFRRGKEIGRVGDNASVMIVPQDEALLGLFAADWKRQTESGRVLGPGLLPVLQDRTGRVWTAGDAGGLTLKEEGRPGIEVDFPQRGQVFGVNELLLDHEGNVWVASPINGLARIRPARVDVPQIAGNASDQSVAALLEDSAGVWWIANRRGGLIRWTPEETRQVEFSQRPAAALFEDRDSRLWVATRGGTVFLHENGAFLPQFTKSQIPSKVRSITQDTAGTIWFGGSQGLSSYEDGQVRQFGIADGVGDLDLSIVQPFPGGKIIAGSTSGAVLLGGEQGFVTLAAPEVMNHQCVSGILPLSPQEVWVSTLGSGLFLWNGTTWRGFGVNDGIPDLRLTCVLDDGNDNIWLGSLSGIIRVERKELLSRIADPSSAVHWLHLDQTDGMPSRECIGRFQPAGWRARDGMLWFPTGGGVVRVRPDLAGANKVPPPVFLKSAMVNGVAQLGESGLVTTDPGRARLEFHFVGLSFSAPEKTTYRARLAGLDDTWRELGNQRVAAFEAVAPGHYVFEVMAVNGEGVRSIQPARISVFVRPHLWETAWFYVSAGVLVLLGAVGTGWFAARRRMKARIQELKIRNAREAERARIARDLHDDLGASLTEISILSALAAEDAGKTLLQPALDQLSTKAKSVVSSLDEIVWAVNPREDTLRSLIEYLAAFAREFLDLADIPLRMDIAPDIPECPLAAPRRHGVFLAAREVLNNIVKHSVATEVNFHVTIAGGILEIRIKDNGRGFEPDYATGGHGLGNLPLRMQEAGGSCRIETFPMRGTNVVLTLPLQTPPKPAS